jgi:hypothetical protein
MNVGQLRQLLTALLRPYLGTFNNGQPAIYVGEPPASWTAQGLECNIPYLPEITQVPAYQTGAITETFSVRLISHGQPMYQRAAVRAILSRWPDAQATEVPANERLGILSQHVVTIPV